MDKTKHGYDFEELIKESCDVQNVYSHRLKTRTSGFKGDNEIADFIIYGKGKLLILEAKSTTQQSFPFSMIRPNQASGMYQTVKTFKDVNAGILLDFKHKDVIYYIPIMEVDRQLRKGKVGMNFSELEKRATKVSKNKYLDILELLDVLK